VNFDPNIIFDIVAFLFAISIHESAHAWSANKLGDPTARLLGRISLNPVKHIDPVGTILFPAIGILSGLPVFGWAKPTPVDTRRLRHPRRDDILVSVAGPASNLLVVLVAFFALIALSFSSPMASTFVRGLPYSSFMARESLLLAFGLMLYHFLFINVLLMVFNLIPVPPLDGSHILSGLLPGKLRDLYQAAYSFSFLLMILLIMSGIPGKLFWPVMTFFVMALRLGAA
jgi:Zn-dependent protease